MPKFHKGRPRRDQPKTDPLNYKTVETESDAPNAETGERWPGDTGPLYPHELDPSAPYDPREPANKADIAELKHELSLLAQRLENLEAPNAALPDEPNPGGVAASAPG